MGAHYNENYYLEGDEEALKGIETRRLERLEKIQEEKEKYKTALEEYNLFLDMTADLLRSLNLSNSLEYSTAISYLIHCGCLSKDGKKIDRSVTEYDVELLSNIGINIVLGEGCCRNISQMHKDLFDRLKMHSKKFYCVQSNYKIGKDAFKEPANHVANLITFDKKLYIFDGYNHSKLYKFVSPYEAFIISNKKFKYLVYKPYFELIFEENTMENIRKSYLYFKNDSESTHITADEWINNYRAKALNYMKKNRELLKCFCSDTEEIKSDICKSLTMGIK